MAPKGVYFRLDKEANKKVKIVLADGGMGNQLFQVSYALYLSDLTGETVAVDFGGGRHCHEASGLAEFVDVLGLQVYSGEGAKILSRLALTQRTLGTWKLLSRPFREGVHVKMADLELHCGYWQDCAELKRYYIRVAEAFRTFLRINPSDEICLHVRLGDYRSYRNQKIYSQIGRDYYYSALRYLGRHRSVESIKVLTNDIAGARDLFATPKFPQIRFIFEPATPMDDFVALCGASSIVASNSTFCWWGALISARRNGLKQLVAPVNWFNPGYRHRQAPSYSALQELAGRPLSFASF